MTDRELLVRVMEGDKSAYRQLFDRFYPILFRQIFYQCQSETLAEDVAQETFIKVWTKRHQFKAGQPFLPLILKIGHHLLLDHFRKQSTRERLRDRVTEMNTPSIPSPEAEVAARILEQKIHHIVKECLPRKCRQVFLLSRVEGLTYQQIGDQMGISRKTVENHLCRALKIIRKKGKNFL